MPGQLMARLRRLPAAAVAGIVAALAAIIAAVLFLALPKGGGTATTPSPTVSTRPAANPLTGVGTAGRVLAVKVDNVGAAQAQQVGLNAADVVYVEQVEGGLSRYLAVYDSNHAPDRVGPVRSARQTDIPLLAAYGHVGLAYSGAISGLLHDLAKADLRNITPVSGLFSNGGSSPTYIRPAQVFARYPDLAQARDVGFRFGANMPGGSQADSVRAAMPTASFVFTANGTTWSIAVDGRSTSLTAVNVIVQHVRVVPGKYTDFNAGHPDNEVFTVTTGSGRADFYRDGKVWHGLWSKPTDTSTTRYTVGDRPMLLSRGNTYVVLVQGPA
ncbi:DUF3048 domain-containing protein [Streptomyces sp. YIM S03343]